MEILKHKKIIGSLFLLLGAFICFVLATVNFQIYGMDDAMPLVAASVVGIVYIAAGYSMLANLAWHPRLAFLAAVISFLNFPFGTALSVYYFWYRSKVRAFLK